MIWARPGCPLAITSVVPAVQRRVESAAAPASGSARCAPACLWVTRFSRTDLVVVQPGVRPGREPVGGADGDPEVGEQLADGAVGGVDHFALAVVADGHRARRADRDVGGAQRQPPRARHRHEVAGRVAELVERDRHGGRGGPDDRALAVHVQPELPAALQHDARAVLDRRVHARRDQVVRRHAVAGRPERAGDVRGGRLDGALLTVDDEPDGLVVEAQAIGAATKPATIAPYRPYLTLRSTEQNSPLCRHARSRSVPDLVTEL